MESKPKRTFLPALSLLVCLSLACSCTESGHKAALPNVCGKAGEVMVVIDKSDWEGAIGSELRDSLCADCPFLPMKEPLYTLINITPSNFGQMFQIHRNILAFNIKADVVNPGVSYRYDRWAHPQIVITVSAPTSEDAFTLLKGDISKILNALEQAERDRVITNTRQYQERKLSGAVKDFIGGNMVFPSGYSLKKQSHDFLWISYETTYVQQGIFIYKYPADGTTSQLSGQSIINKRNAVLQKEVPGMRDGSYMTTSDILTPSVKYMSYHNRKFAEVRGFWDVHGDFMGGPFVSHTFFTPDGLNLICLESYVYAPKYDKRLYLRQVESLLYSFEWDEVLSK